MSKPRTRAKSAPSTKAVKPLSAVAKLLERVLDADDLRKAAELVASTQTDQESLSSSAFIFRLGAEWLGLTPSIVDEVVEPRVIHTLPHRRDGVVRGLVNVRGQLTVCVALEPLFQLEATSHTQGNQGLLGRRLVVLASQGQRVAFEADEVHGSHRYDPASVKAVPATVAHSMSRFSTGVMDWSDRTVGLLDAELMLHAINRRLG